MITSMNSMLWFYVIALIPSLIGLFLYFKTEKVNLTEWICGSAIAFVIAGIMHICAYVGMTSDQEIWSGQITQTVRHPFWIEEYQVSIYRTETYPSIDMDGNLHMKTREVFDHYETRHRDHPQYFNKTVDFGSGEIQAFNIGESEFKAIVEKFGPINTVAHKQSGFDGGDSNIYVCPNRNGFIIPATTIKKWTNKVLASPSTFSYAKVPDSAPVYNYPSCLDMWQSDRLLGDAGVKINTLSLDQMNARLGPRKKVNVIIIGFTSADAKLGKLQEAKFLGGKKNDVVICYGFAPLEGNVPNVCWTYCFSFCKNEQMKRNIEKMFLEGPIDDSILPKLYEEIVKNYQKREWSEFDTLTVKPRAIHYYILIGIMFITQFVLYLIFYFNGWNKLDQKCLDSW